VARGKTVVIREKRIEDVPDDYAWRTDEELARMDATLPIRMSFEDFSRFSKEELMYSNRTSRRLAIDILDGKHIGNCMYYDIDSRRGRAELGIMIGDRDYWDKGYGTDSVDSLLTHIFVTTALKVVYLHTLDWNQRARRSFAKSGFREVKKVRHHGLDFVLMEIDRQAWKVLYQETGGGSNAEQDGQAPPGEITGQ
jgi:RimJ/RimL family protein N-acetyltransferase